MRDRGTALITGASGGMGRACARLFGGSRDLVLTDASPALAGFAEELAGEGHAVRRAATGDLGDPELVAGLVGALGGAAAPLIVHTAGLSPAQADVRAIMAVNLVATVRLLDALEPALRPGSVAVLIASTAGHLVPPDAESGALLARPLEPGFLDAIVALVAARTAADPVAAPGLAYSLSKQAVLALVERRAIEWGRLGARIVSISPGLITTPMGRRELAETRGAAQLAEAAPAGRTGTAMDIALAARFLAGEEAGFITGSDLKVDGGGIAAVKAMMAQRH